MSKTFQKFDEQDLQYYQLLAQQFPTIKDVCREIINLESILNLPKGTEHFMSDIHGEFDAFKHILNNCSGVIKEKIKTYFYQDLTKGEMEELSTLIYYPCEKMKQLKTLHLLDKQWLRIQIHYLILLIKKLSLKYTRSKVRKAIPEAYVYIIEELINERDHDSHTQKQYQNHIIETMISIDMAEEFIIVLTDLIKRLAVDQLHIIGDIYDRGERPDKIIDLLMQYHNIDIQWGNHDILWMGACCGNLACITRVIKNCLSYHNEKILENRYAISLRLLERYAQKRFPYLKRREAMLQTISIMLLKCEGTLILKHPEYQMDHQLKLHQVHNHEIIINHNVYKINNIENDDCCYELNDEENELLLKLQSAFKHSEKLNAHVKFLYKKGSMYLCVNQMLLYHGCVPIDKNGHFTGIKVNEHLYKGKELFEYCEQQARKAYYKRDLEAIDFMFYLWSGYHSPLSGRELKTFERIYIHDEKVWVEKRNPYYQFYHQEEICCQILKEFQMDPKKCHIINGHTPVKLNEKPLKANGKVIVIDGGFCKRYQKETGIAGYTLISNSHGILLKSHTPFKGIDRVLQINSDIHSSSENIEVYQHRMLVKDSDIGEKIIEQMTQLKILLDAYQTGIIIPK
ncbi:fructose-1,6-bisphosphatase [Longibaculum muris]|uniref:fructose-1,6-bisphosphatase n=1 Tax=Longibaculum muris TaxID=1796628 RepID=UPI0012B9D0BB|nr:fructose-1,6-bisphosphatase [Longibaculum muris]